MHMGTIDEVSFVVVSDVFSTQSMVILEHFSDAQGNFVCTHSSNLVEKSTYFELHALAPELSNSPAKYS